MVCGFRRLSRLRAGACKGNATKAARIAFACLQPDRRLEIAFTRHALKLGRAAPYIALNRCT